MDTHTHTRILHIAHVSQPTGPHREALPPYWDVLRKRGVSPNLAPYFGGTTWRNTHKRISPTGQLPGVALVAAALRTGAQRH